MESQAIISRIKRGKNVVILVSMKKGDKMFGFVKPVYTY